MRTLIRFTAVAIVTLVGIGLLAQQQPKPDQVPLGDLVKQQKAAKKAKRVITDDDMPARPPEPVPPAAAEGNAAGTEGPADKKAPDTQAAAPKLDDEARAKKIATLKESEEAEKRIIQRMEQSLAEPNLSESRRRIYEETLNSARELLGKFQSERQALEQQAAASKAPAPPK